MAHVMITLRQDERDALYKLALRELRTPRDQARFILRQELERLGLLQSITPAPQNEREDAQPGPTL